MIRPDSVILSSQLPNFIQIATYTGSMIVSGTVASGGGTATFSCTIPVTRSNSKYDVYAYNPAVGKQLINGTNYITVYHQKSSEIHQTSLVYTASSIIFSIFITNNTGAPITLIVQTFIVSAVEYRTPF